MGAGKYTNSLPRLRGCCSCQRAVSKRLQFHKNQLAPARASGPLNPGTWLLKSPSGEIPTVLSTGRLAEPVSARGAGITCHLPGENPGGQAGPWEERQACLPPWEDLSSLALCSLQVYEVPVACQALCWEGPEENSSSPVCGPAPGPPAGLLSDLWVS